MTADSSIRDRRYSQHVLERLPFQQFHGDEWLPVVLVNVVNSADVGVIEGTRGLRFPLESLQSVMVLRELFRQELERDKAAELGVLGLIHHAHPAAPELLHDAVMRNRFSNHD